MSALDEIREKYPQYNSWTDQELADGLHAKAYATMPKEEFYQQVGFNPAAPKRTTEGMGTMESVTNLIRTGGQETLAAVGSIPRAITQMRTQPNVFNEIAAAEDWQKANPGKPLTPEVRTQLRSGIAAKPAWGETVEQLGQKHLWTADDIMANIAAAVTKQEGEQYMFTRPTEASGRVLQAGARGATAALPALLTGQPELLLGAMATGGAGSAAGQGVREAGGPELLATGVELASGLATPTRPLTKMAQVAGAAERATAPVSTQLLREAAKSMAQPEIDSALSLMRTARDEFNNPLTFGQAANQVTGGRMNELLSLERYIENARGGSGLGAAQAGRAEAMGRNVEQQATNIAGPALQGEELLGLPGRVQQRGQEAYRRIEQAEGAAARPFYEQGVQQGDVGQILGPNRQNWEALGQRPVIRRAFANAQTARANEGLPPHQWLDIADDGTVTITAVPDPADLDRMVKQVQAEIDGMETASGKPLPTANPLIAARDDLVALANTIPGYEQARTTFGTVAEANRPVKSGALGDIMTSGGGSAEDAFTKQVAALLPKGAQVTDAASLRMALRQLQGGRRGGRRLVNPEARQLLGTYMRGLSDKAQRVFKSQGGDPQNAGAAFRAAIGGTPREREMLQAMIEETAGPEAWQGFNRMMDVFEAQGYRRPANSATTFNQAIKDWLEQPRGPMDLPTAIEAGAEVAQRGPGAIVSRGVQTWKEKAKQQRATANADRLSQLVMDPEALEDLRLLAPMDPSSPNAARIVAKLLGMGAAVSGEKMQPEAPEFIE